MFDLRVHRRSEEHGFTLIELLVVILIIGILAAIAIPVFLNQRQKGYDAAAKSDLRDLANFEEVYLNDYDSYGNITDLQTHEPSLGVSHGVVLSILHMNGATSYCLSAKQQNSPNTWYYDSLGGGLQPANGGCPLTTSGPSGGTVTG